MREHLYYRCANNERGNGHPTVRWRAEDVEQAVWKHLAAMAMEPEWAVWMRQALASAFADAAEVRERRRKMLTQRRGELVGMKDRLLSAFLAAAIDEVTFQSKSAELKTQIEEVEEALHRCNDGDIHSSDKSLAPFDWSQQAAERFKGSNAAGKREILTAVSLNRTLGDVTLCLQKRKPFDLLAERPSVTTTRGGGI